MIAMSSLSLVAATALALLASPASAATSTSASAKASSSTASTAQYKPTTATYNWEITYVQTAPDGVTRRAIGVNNKWPIDPIIITEGDTLVINMKNSLEEPTSLHSHGFFQNGTQQYDGVSGVTQCPTPPGASLTYTIPVKQHGTYWIHGHNLGHYVDGLRAPIIIKNPNEPNKYDDEYVVSLSDWYHNEHKDILPTFMSIYNPAGLEPIPDNPLINEKMDATFNFVPGKTYRLRIVSMSAIAMFQFWIDGHDMSVIEVDGVDVEPMPATSLMVGPAQRYSVLVTARAANNGTNFNYQIHGNMDLTMFDSPPATLNPNANATIVYSASNPIFVPAVTDPSDMMLDDTTLVPLDNIAPVIANEQVYLAVSFQVMTDGVNHGTFNQVPYVRPRVPSLFSAATLDSDAKMNPNAYGINTAPYVLKHMDGIEVVIDNLDAGNHPFHLHGHVFQLIEVNGDHGYDPTNLTATVPQNPSRRDTVIIPGGGYAIIRFIADNPGVWLIHCHIEWHFSAGLVSTFVEAPEKINLNLDPAFTSQCVSQGIATSGNAAGNKGLDLSGYSYGPGILPTTITSKGWWAIAGCTASALVGVATIVWFARPEKK